MAPKKKAAPAAPKKDLAAMGSGKDQKPKRPPPPPACFTLEDILRFKEIFKQYDTMGIDKVKITSLPTMLRVLGFNPKGSDMEYLFQTFLEDEFEDTIEVWKWYKMIEAKKNMGDDVEHDVEVAMAFLGHDNEEKPTEIIKLDTLQEELMNWGEVLTEAEFADWPKIALKEKCYVFETNDFQYLKFITNMNAKDTRFNPEPINFFKLDQKQLAALAREKAAQEREIAKKKALERQAREMAKRQRAIEQGLLQPEEAAKLPNVPGYTEPMSAFEILRLGL